MYSTTSPVTYKMLTGLKIPYDGGGHYPDRGITRDITDVFFSWLAFMPPAAVMKLQVNDTGSIMECNGTV